MSQAEGIDCSWGRLTAAQLKNAGKSFCLRYLYPDGEGGKGLDKDELARLAGVEVPVIFESTAQRALDGFAAGVVDAQEAQAQLVAVGLPADMPIYMAVDFDITDAQKPVAGEYHKGVASVLSLARTGTYGGYWWVKYASENNLASFFYQTYAWSGGLVHPAAHIYQYKNGQTIDGQAVDFDRALQDNYGQPSKFGSTGPTPAQTPVAESNLITLGANYAGYVNSADAAAGRNSNSQVTPGTYRITNRANGMVNVVRMDGTGGWWINPNGAQVGAPAPQPAGPQYAVKSGDTLGALAKAWGTTVAAIIETNRSEHPSIGTGSNALLVVGWVIVNPAGGGAMPSSQAQYVTAQSGWGLSNVAQEAGFSDAGSSARWAAIAALNGSSDWRVFNAGLRPNQQVRVR